MSRRRSKKPKPSDDAITVTKKLAAISQLETAIQIWFNYGDALSILALASNANDCYDAMAGHVGAPSMYQTWLKSQSQTFQDRARYVYEFIRHGRKDLKQRTPYSPRQGEMLIADSIDCHNRLFSEITPLMSAYGLRLMLENADAAVSAQHAAFFAKASNVYKFAERPRPDFLQAVLKIAAERIASGTLGKPEIFGALPLGTGLT